MISEDLYQAVSKYCCHGFNFRIDFDFARDYEFEKNVDLACRVDLFLRSKYESKFPSDYQYDQKCNYIFPELESVCENKEFPYIRWFIHHYAQGKTSMEVVKQISQENDYSFFFERTQFVSIGVQSQRTHASIINFLFHNPVDSFQVASLFRQRSQFYIPHQLCTANLQNNINDKTIRFDCLFYLDFFQTIFYNQVLLDGLLSKTLILTDNLALAQWNSRNFARHFDYSDIAWISWYCKNNSEVPENLPWSKLSHDHLFWLFVPHTSQSFEEALQVLDQVERQLERNGISKAQLNIISYWGPDRSREKYPSIMTNQEFHDKVTNGNLFLSSKKIPLNTTEILVAKTSDATEIEMVILGEYYGWWPTHNIPSPPQLLIIDFTGNHGSLNLPSQNIQYNNTSSQIDNLEAILNQKINPFLTVIIIGGIPTVRGRLDLFAARLSEVFFKHVIIISDEISLKPISITGSIKVTRIKSKTKYLLKVERKGKNITYKKYYCEIRDGQWRRLKKTGYKRLHLSKSKREEFKNMIRLCYLDPFNHITIKEIAQKLKITESLVKKIKQELGLSKPQRKTRLKTNPLLY